jgi:hypothetical protein
MYTFYLFAVSLFGLLTFYLSITGGFSSLSAALIPGDETFWQTYAAISNLSAAVVSGVVWFIHWRMLDKKRGAHSQGEHKLVYFYLLFAAIMLVMGMVSNGREMLIGFANLALDLGEGQANYAIAALVNLLIVSGLWLYHMRAFKQEAEYGKIFAKKEEAKS